jgi:hypothetical protein
VSYRSLVSAFAKGGLVPDRINHLAVWVAAIVYFLLGYVWYSLLFGNVWMQLMGKQMSGAQPSPTLFVEGFLLGLILAYATAIALTRRPEDQTAQQGVSFALFMGLAIYGTQTLNNALYAGVPFTLWLINTGYVIVGFAIMGAIIGGWKKRTPA